MNDSVYTKVLKSVLLLTFSMIIFVAIIINIPNPLITNSNDWIGFYGSIVGSLVGGLMTFIGVQISINHNENVRVKGETDNNERKRLEILPHITMESRILGFSHTITDDNKDYDYYRTKIKFRNIGRDTCINLSANFKILGITSPFNEIPAYFFIDSLVKGELSNGFDFLICEERFNYKKVVIEFYDLEHRLYEQEIEVSNIFNYPASEEPISISTIITHSGFPKLKNSGN